MFLVILLSSIWLRYRSVLPELFQIMENKFVKNRIPYIEIITRNHTFSDFPQVAETSLLEDASSASFESVFSSDLPSLGVTE